MMPTAHSVLVDRYLAEILNRVDFSRADEILAPDFVFRSPSHPEGLNRTGLRIFLEEIHAAFSNKHFTELERISDETRVAFRFRMTGKQDGTLQGIPPLGVELDEEGCDLIYIRQYRIAEVRAYFDLLAIVQKFLIPAPVRLIQQILQGLHRP
jgi:predicted ester cyclase